MASRSHKLHNQPMITHTDDPLDGLEKSSTNENELKLSLEHALSCAISVNNHDQLLKFCRVGLDKSNLSFGAGALSDESIKAFIQFLVENENRFSEYIITRYVDHLIHQGQFNEAIGWTFSLVDKLNRWDELFDNIVRVLAFRGKSNHLLQLLTRSIQLGRTGMYELITVYALLNDRPKLSPLLRNTSALRPFPYSADLFSEEEKIKHRIDLARRNHWRWHGTLLGSLQDHFAAVELFVENGDNLTASRILENSPHHLGAFPLYLKLEIATKHNLPCENRIQKELLENLNKNADLASGPVRNPIDCLNGGMLADALKAESDKPQPEAATLAYIWDAMGRTEKAVEILEQGLKNKGLEFQVVHSTALLADLPRLYFKLEWYEKAAEFLVSIAKPGLPDYEKRIYTASQLFALAGDTSRQKELMLNLEFLLSRTARAADIALIYWGEEFYDDFDRICQQYRLDELSALLNKKAGRKPPSRQAEKRETAPESRGSMNTLVDIHTCPQCQKQNKPGALFCKHCGFSLATTIQCLNPNCGAENEPDAQFCDRCGSRLVVSRSDLNSKRPSRPR